MVAVSAPERYRRKPGVIETDLGDELVLLDPATREMFSLNATGRLLWRLLPDDGVEGVVRGIVDGFEVDEITARADALALVAELRRAGLVEAL
jgi:hypothetical protein